MADEIDTEVLDLFRDKPTLRAAGVAKSLNIDEKEALDRLMKLADDGFLSWGPNSGRYEGGAWSEPPHFGLQPKGRAALHAH